MDNFKQPKRSYPRGRGIDGFAPRRPSTSAHTPVATNFKPVSNTQLHPVKKTQGFSASSSAMNPLNSHDSKAPLDSVGHGQGRGKKARRSAKPKRSLGRKVFRVSAIMFTLAVLFVGGLAGYGYLKARQIFNGSSTGAVALEKNVDPVKLKGEGDGRVNVLMLGIGGEGHDGAYLTDTIIIASVDPVQNEAALLSVPRDLWVKKSGGSAGKINEVYVNARDSELAKSKDKEAANKAGVAASEKVLTEVLGIKIDYSVIDVISSIAETPDKISTFW